MRRNRHKILREEIFPLLSSKLRIMISQIDNSKLEDLIEIRLRSFNPLILERSSGESFITKQGRATANRKEAYIVTPKDIQESLSLMTNSSLFTLEEELRCGYFTLAGGHRVGLVGQAILEKQKLKRLKHISALNIRICQEIIGAADGVINKVIRNKDDIYNTLIVSPPRCGKTTLIRDLARQISNGINSLSFRGLKVGIVDERSEIGGAYQGIAQNNLGIRSDLLDRCPKAEGMMLLIRSMSPEVIITDEIGRKEDVSALQEAINSGVRIITTAHGSSFDEVKQRPNLKEIIEANFFQRIIILSSRKGPGTVEKIFKV